MNLSAPSLEFARCDLWLRDVIEHKDLLGMTVDEANCFLKLMFKDEDVIYKAGSPQDADAAIEVLAVEEALWLGLHHMTHTHELRVGRECAQGALKMGR